jgi:hypothetical protein
MCRFRPSGLRGLASFGSHGQESKRIAKNADQRILARLRYVFCGFAFQPRRAALFLAFGSKEPAMENEDQVREVTKSVEAKLGLLVHFLVYVGVNAALVVVNLATDANHLWFQWVLLGWGAGLIFHAALVWVCARGGSIKARMIAHELTRRGYSKS